MKSEKQTYNVTEHWQTKGLTIKIKDMTPEQIKRVEACETSEELLAVMADEGVELTDSQLEQVSGGGWTGHTCPNCGSPDIDLLNNGGMICDKCGYRVDY